MILLVIMMPITERTTDYHEIACQQVLAEDHSVFSIQWIVIPGTAPREITSEELLSLYLEHIERFTRGAVRPRSDETGLEFRLGTSPVTLLHFDSPLHKHDRSGSRTTLRICGGFLVQPRKCDRGQLDFMVERLPYGTRLTLQLSDYCPLLLGSSRPSPWRRWLYRLTQAWVHKVVTVRFLARVYRRLTGEMPKTRIVTVARRTGRAT